MLGDIFNNKWTVQNGGVSTFDGWTKEAVTRFEEFRTWNKEARAKESTAVLEKACLDYLRSENGCTATSIEEERAKKRRKVRDHLGDDGDESEGDMEDFFD